MNNFISKLKTAARTMRLTAEEKQRMRVALYDAMKHSPRLLPAQPSPVKVVKSPYVFLSPKWASALAVVLVLGLGSGTAFAAQGALPTSPLWAVKVNVNEKVAVALATSPEAKAQVNASIAQERLQEAEALAQKGALNASTSQELAANFDAHAQAAQDITDTLGGEDPAAAAQLSTEFDSSLAAHGAILLALGSASKDEGTKNSSDELAMRVREHERGSHDEEEAVTLAVAASASGTATSAPAQNARTFSAAFAPSSTASSSATSSEASSSEAKQGSGNSEALRTATFLQTRAQAQLNAAQALFNSLKASLDASTTAQVQSELDDINTRIASGTQALAGSDGSGALAQFEAALRASVTLDTYLSAGRSLNIPSLLPMLFGHGGKGGDDNSDNSGKGSGNSGDTSNDSSGKGDANTANVLSSTTSASSSTAPSSPTTTQTSGGHSGSGDTGSSSGSGDSGSSSNSGSDSGSHDSGDLKIDVGL